jgi:hypothetical protein
MMRNLDQLTVDELARACEQETQKFLRQQESTSVYCFELFRRAFIQHDIYAFTHIYSIYEPQVKSWVRRHTGFARTGEPVEYFVSATMSSFYFAMQHGKFSQFQHLAQALQYLKLCAHTAITGYLRRQDAVVETPLDEMLSLASTDTSQTQEMMAADLWAQMCRLIPDKTDQLLMRCVFVEQLKPAEILDAHPNIWESARAVSVALQRIRRILRRDEEIRRRAGIIDEEMMSD